MRWLTLMGLLLTVAWVAGYLCLYFLVMPDTVVGSENPRTFFGLAVNEQGDFMAGFSAPLAFLWLVIGSFQQTRQIKQNSEALEIQQKELRNQVEEMQATRQEIAAQAKALQANNDLASMNLFYVMLPGMVKELAACVRTITTNIGGFNFSGHNSAPPEVLLYQFYQKFQKIRVHAGSRESVVKQIREDYKKEIHDYCFIFSALLREAVKAADGSYLAQFYAEQTSMGKVNALLISEIWPEVMADFDRPAQLDDIIAQYYNWEWSVAQ